MRQAIVTKYLGPTNHRGARIKAICDAKTITRAWDDASDPQANHERIATTLALDLGWLDNQKLVGGAMPLNGNPYAYCFVLVSKR